ncbi:DUF6090 family protein [Muriicola sp. E247]|uniref:DUF6090 family protein n=1 Tax=Muriicola sp. E247 TaxID=3242730 RepID=UPI00352478F9
MIKFFRKIRQRLLAENKVSRYLLYAIGEIILVVIGILIALQINNWNEGKKEAKMARNYLIGIKNDLKKDNDLLDSLIQTYANEISLINEMDKSFEDPVYEGETYKSLFISPDTSLMKYIFYRGISFRPITATYTSMIADGRSGLIKNRELFEGIQEIYDERHSRMASVYESFKPSENRIHWTYGYEKKNWTYRDLLASREDKIFIDLFNFVEAKYFYTQHLFNLRKKNKELIALIEQETKE